MSCVKVCASPIKPSPSQTEAAAAQWGCGSATWSIQPGISWSPFCSFLTTASTGKLFNAINIGLRFLCLSRNDRVHVWKPGSAVENPALRTSRSRRLYARSQPSPAQDEGYLWLSGDRSRRLRLPELRLSGHFPRNWVLVHHRDESRQHQRVWGRELPLGTVEHQRR